MSRWQGTTTNAHQYQCHCTISRAAGPTALHTQLSLALTLTLTLTSTPRRAPTGATTLRSSPNPFPAPRASRSLTAWVPSGPWTRSVPRSYRRRRSAAPRRSRSFANSGASREARRTVESAVLAAAASAAASAIAPAPAKADATAAAKAKAKTKAKAKAMGPELPCALSSSAAIRPGPSGGSSDPSGAPTRPCQSRSGCILYTSRLELLSCPAEHHFSGGDNQRAFDAEPDGLSR